MNIFKTRAELQAAVQSARAAGKRIVLVPTMGYLHEGHLTLVDTARAHGDVVVMSIYVNPLQFGPNEDLARYPRNMERDTGLAGGRGVDIIFAPDDDEMYGSDKPAVTVHAPHLADRLCGLFRPGHFEGVLTVVAKLFNIVQPDAAVFGQKDFQQHVLIRRMVRDLSYPIDIIVAPIIREQDGLAMSSRNVYLSGEERAAALALSRALRVAQLRYRNGERKPAALVLSARQLLDAERGVTLQYVEVVDPASLDTPGQADDTSVMAVAAVVGKTRLIDNASSVRVDLELPEWAVVGEARRAHIARVAALVRSWANERDLPAYEKSRWFQAAILHDALRNASPHELRTRVPQEFASWPDLLLHGPAAATRLRKDHMRDEAC